MREASQCFPSDRAWQHILDLACSAASLCKSSRALDAQSALMYDMCPVHVPKGPTRRDPLARCPCWLPSFRTSGAPLLEHVHACFFSSFSFLPSRTLFSCTNPEPLVFLLPTRLRGPSRELPMRNGILWRTRARVSSSFLFLSSFSLPFLTLAPRLRQSFCCINAQQGQPRELCFKEGVFLRGNSSSLSLPFPIPSS